MSAFTEGLLKEIVFFDYDGDDNILDFALDKARETRTDYKIVHVSVTEDGSAFMGGVGVEQIALELLETIEEIIAGGAMAFIVVQSLNGITAKQFQVISGIVSVCQRISGGVIKLFIRLSDSKIT